MALLPVKKPTRSANGTLLGAVPASAGGDSFPNTGAEFFYAKATGATVLTFDSPATCSFELGANAAHDLVVNLGAGEERIVGPFPTGRFNDANNLVQVTYTVAAGVTVTPLASA